MKSIKDLIYFDTEKARSILSQLNQGLISEISRAFEDETELNTGIGFDVKVVKGNIGGRGKEKIVKTEKITLYHEMLNSLERELQNSKIITDVNDSFQKGGKSFDEFMKDIPRMNFIKANGWGVFEDYERFKRIFGNFNEVQRLIFQSQLDNNPELKQLRIQLDEAKKSANKNKDRNTKSKELKKISAIEKNLDNLLESKTQINLLDEEFIRRIQVLLDTFSPNRLNFRLVPLDTFSDFQILGNLKSKYIIDGDFENIIFTYGSKPNIKLSVIGVITSAPQQIDIRVNPNDEFLTYADNELSEVQVFDKAFRNVFDSFEVFEKFFFVPSYPKISISPIAIYREIIIDGKD